jgi:Uncharacterized protein conserved in bacteria
MDDLLAELSALESELHHPGVTCTRERLERLLHADFHEVGRSGTRYTRQTVIDFLADRPSPPRVLAYDHRIERLSDGVALLHFASHGIAGDGTRHTAHGTVPRYACRCGDIPRSAGSCPITRVPLPLRSGRLRHRALATE